MSVPSPWWRPDRHADRRPFLMARGAIKSTIRDYFLADGFVEVEPDCLQVSPGNETHLHAFSTERIGTDLSRRTLYLNTSPEFALKKLLAAGEAKIFAFQPAFRNREDGPLHAREFTMLEWYRTGEDTSALIGDCARIVRLAAAVTQRAQWSWKDRACNLLEEAEHLTVAQAFAAHARIALFGQAETDGTIDRDAFAREAFRCGLTCAPDDTWSDIFSRVSTAVIEPKLGVGAPTILCSYPISEAALARPDPRDPRIAERFELYVCGVELANGFGELNDPDEQRRRFEADMDEKEARYGERYPIDEDFLAALAEMPPAAGCALGFDRLVMLATGAPHIDQVRWTPATS